MSSIHSYLTFGGNCREAMQFYKSCLGGRLHLRTIGESPLSEKMPAKMKDCILHATLKKRGLILMGTDMTSDKGLTKGNAVSLMLNCGSVREIKACYKKLSEGGQATHPLETTFFGAVIGNLVDRFGNNWVLHYQGKNNI